MHEAVSGSTCVPPDIATPTRASLPKRAPGFVLVLFALAVLASAAAGHDTEIEEIIVTGSRIPRPDFQSASPIVSVLEQEFRRTAALTVETVLGTMPQVVPTVTSTSNAMGNGQANIDLRGLGAGR